MWRGCDFSINFYFFFFVSFFLFEILIVSKCLNIVCFCFSFRFSELFISAFFSPRHKNKIARHAFFFFIYAKIACPNEVLLFRIHSMNEWMVKSSHFVGWIFRFESFLVRYLIDKTKLNWRCCSQRPFSQSNVAPYDVNLIENRHCTLTACLRHSFCFLSLGHLVRCFLLLLYCFSLSERVCRWSSSFGRFVYHLMPKVFP